jgi:hypothetical protein
MIKQYIVIRSLIVRGGADKDKKFIFIHEDNEANRKGRVLEEGVVYPLSEDIPILLAYGDQKKKITFLELKARANEPIVFED